MTVATASSNATATAHAEWTAAADNLLLACGELRPGSRVLMINEPARTIEQDVVDFIAQRATALGGRVRTEWVERVDGPDSIPAPLIRQIEESDLAIFNHQMGSMLRLRPLAGNGVRILNYATTSSIIDSDFARIPYDLWVRTVQLLAARLAQAKTWSMTCPSGTNLTGTIPIATRPAPAKGDGFSLKTFPIGTHQPIPSAGASGTLALRWLVTSAVHNIGTPGMRLEDAVVARVEDSRIVDIEGDADQVEDVRVFLDRVGDRMKKDPYQLNSWHAGINPQTIAPYGDKEDIEHWMLLAHNSPRLAHFHIVGEAVPGELSVPVLNPTIAFDGKVLWQDGTLSFLRSPAVEMLAKEAGSKTAFESLDLIKV